MNKYKITVEKLKKRKDSADGMFFLSNGTVIEFEMSAKNHYYRQWGDSLEELGFTVDRFGRTVLRIFRGKWY